MSLGIYKEFDNSFFSVRIKGSDGKEMYSSDVISLTYTEEVNKMTEGSITFYDPNHFYSSLFRDNRPIDIDFGYKKWDDNLTQSQNVFVRKSVRCLVQNPSGQGDSQGNVIFSCNFIAGTSSNWERKVTKTFKSGTYATMVAGIFADMGINKTYINFINATMAISEKEPVKQSETGNFRFLAAFALKNGCMFRIGTAKDGTLYGIFAQTGDYKANILASTLTGGTGQPYQFDYKGGRNNVMSYAWSRQTNNDGGDLVMVHYVNGQPVFKRYAVDRETVTGYTFHPEVLQAEARRLNQTLGPDAVLKRMSELLKNDDFDYLLKKGYFTRDPYSSYTPQGLGYEINLECLGDPILTPAVIANFGGSKTAGFPAAITADAKNKLTFYVLRVSHQLSKDGYKCSVNAIDSLGILAKRIAL